MTEAPLTECPECGAPATRVFYPVGVVFKGQGFYKTDSRGSGGIAPGTANDGAGAKDGKSEKDGKSGKEAAKTEVKATTSDTAGKDGGSKGGGVKADAPSTPPPAKSEEKTA